jgi:predicted MPP superfamily phosphohydrolase
MTATAPAATGERPEPAPSVARVRSRARRIRASRTFRALVLIVIAVFGAWLGLLVGGNETRAVGPVETKLSLRPALTGDSVIEVPPLGSLSLDSHDGPLQLHAEVVRLNAQDTRAIFNDPATLRTLPDQVTEDVRAGIRDLLMRSLLAAAVGAFVLGLVFWRRVRRALLAAAVAVVIVAASAGAAAATWNPRAVNEPRYSGLIASAPGLVGSAEQIVGRFDVYRDQLAKIVTNVSKLYDVGSSLPAFAPDDSTLRVLHVSDIHLNPAAWDVIRSIVQQFHVDLIIDTGDISDHGSALETAFVNGISTVGVPYVYIGGNHDSGIIDAAVAHQANAIVLQGQPVDVKGLRIIGDRDPRFTPDKSTRDQGNPESIVVDQGLVLAATARAATPPPKIALVHDPTAAPPLDGVVPLVLAGHVHKRSTYRLPGSTRVFVQGSTGGAGLRGLEHESPTPIECSVLYLSKADSRLQAWDDITLGGLGLASAQVERHLPEEVIEPPEPSTSSPVPTSTASPSRP